MNHFESADDGSYTDDDVGRVDDDSDGPRYDGRELYGRPQHERPSSDGSPGRRGSHEMQMYGSPQHEVTGELASDEELARWTVEHRSDDWSESRSDARSENQLDGWSETFLRVRGTTHTGPRGGDTRIPP